MMPISVLMPTLNSAALLPRHLKSMDPWLDLVEEVVVVDSHSQDATVQMIQSALRHPRLRIISHPKGLYQSWNHGIRQLGSKYCYVSTVGDSITRAGLEELHRVAEAFQCDVVISKPRFIDKDDRELPEAPWPIDDLFAHFPDTGPALFEGLDLYFFALANCTGAILGSSASNLYRTPCLQERPFSTEYGTAGDGAWGLANALDVRLGAVRERVSTFRYHPKAYLDSDYAVAALNDKLYALACRTFACRAGQSRQFQADAAQLKIDEVMQIAGERLACQKRLEDYRGKKWPWVLNPGAWLARFERASQVRRLATLKQSVLPEIHRRKIEAGGRAPCGLTSSP
ncbi:MAG: hypothetical protein JWR26_3128 [Pedosphaera sp.]|nr:hypothetical protein [Pedosphaera sp.]